MSECQMIHSLSWINVYFLRNNDIGAKIEPNGLKGFIDIRSFPERVAHFCYCRYFRRNVTRAI